MEEDKDFLRHNNDYRSPKAFRKAECTYDVAFHFAHQVLQAGDRGKIRERSDETIANIAITPIPPTTNIPCST